MFKNKITAGFVLLAFVLAFTLLAGAGCAGTRGRDDGLSSRPWNTQKSWEHGIPTGMMEGR
jgi:hypothetical protein